MTKQRGLRAVEFAHIVCQLSNQGLAPKLFIFRGFLPPLLVRPTSSPRRHRSCGISSALRFSSISKLPAWEPYLQFTHGQWPCCRAGLHAGVFSQPSSPMFSGAATPRCVNCPAASAYKWGRSIVAKSCSPSVHCTFGLYGCTSGTNACQLLPASGEKMCADTRLDPQLPTAGNELA